MKVYGQLEKAQLELLAASTSTLTPLVPGRIYFDTDSNTLKVYSGSTWLTFSTGGASGGGGGSNLSWTNEGDNAALTQVENGLTVFQFEQLLQQQVKTSILVPASFVTGTQIYLYIAAYSPSSSNEFRFTVVSTLILAGTDTISSSSLIEQSSVSTTNTLSNKLNRIALTLTDSSGKVGGTTVRPGDLLLVQLFRYSADTDTGVVRVLASGSEVKFS